jgi:murein DD-endopeptidase MepM/ murein hydrolase activator NlpD
MASQRSLMTSRARLIACAIVATLSSTANAAMAQAPTLQLPELQQQPAELDFPRSSLPALHGLGPIAPPATSHPPGPFAVCPVDPPRHFRDDFGDARYFGGFHRHEGIDIFAPGGTPVRAPFDGVAESSTNSAGGLSVTLTGRAGFIYNAHLSSIGGTGKVEAGTVIGGVGNSGDARGGSTHDHFEWHPNGGPAVNPFRLLRAVCSARLPTGQQSAHPFGGHDVALALEQDKSLAAQGLGLVDSTTESKHL